MEKHAGAGVSQTRGRATFENDLSAQPGETAAVPILMYHRIASDGPAGLVPYRTSPEAFERQLAHLQRSGYAAVGLDDVWRSYDGSGHRQPGRPIALTFDDAYQDFADAAWPLLQRYGFTATVFAPSGHMGRRAEWDRDFGEPAPLMAWKTLRRLAAEGLTVGAHSVTHRSLPSLSLGDLAEEVQRSREAIAQELGVAPNGFCFPYTDFNANVKHAVREAGYAYAVGGDVPAHEVDRFALPRIEVRGEVDLETFIASLPRPLPSGPGAS